MAEEELKYIFQTQTLAMKDICQPKRLGWHEFCKLSTTNIVIFSKFAWVILTFIWCNCLGMDQSWHNSLDMVVFVMIHLFLSPRQIVTLNFIWSPQNTELDFILPIQTAWMICLRFLFESHNLTISVFCISLGAVSCCLDKKIRYS